MNTDKPMAVLVIADTPAFARWTLWLVEALEKRPGVDVFLEIAEAGPGDGASALATLLTLERMLLRRGRDSGSDRLSRDLAASRALQPGRKPDLVIDLTERDGEHADATVLRPLYNGHRGETALASALFFGVSPEIAVERTLPGAENRHIAAAGAASLEAASGIGGGIEAVASRVVTLVLKALPEPGSPPSLAGASNFKTVRAISRRDIFAYSAKSVARLAARAAYHLCCHGSHWRIGWRFVEPGQDVWTRRNLSGPTWNVLPDPVDHFYADPFPLTWKGRDYLFFEDLDQKTGRGIISVVAFDEAGRPGPTMPVLQEPWHLSYPFLIEWGGDIWMIPESSTNGDIAIYRAKNFPLTWERHATLLSGLEAADATIIDHDGLLWMFAVVRDGVGGYSDTLGLWSATDLFGPWTPHPNNPVLVDDRTARPAGNLVRRDGKLYRPAQDCGPAYGAAVNFMRVTKLDRQGFSQEIEGTIGPNAHWPGRRLHTLNYNGRLEAIDGFVPRPKLKLAADWVDAYYRPKG